LQAPDPLFFGSVPHTRALLANQHHRLANGLNASRLGSLRPGSDFYRYDWNRVRDVIWMWETVDQYYSTQRAYEIWVKILLAATNQQVRPVISKLQVSCAFYQKNFRNKSGHNKRCRCVSDSRNVPGTYWTLCLIVAVATPLIFFNPNESKRLLVIRWFYNHDFFFSGKKNTSP